MSLLGRREAKLVGTLLGLAAYLSGLMAAEGTAQEMQPKLQKNVQKSEADVVIRLPERLMMGAEVLREVGRQTGWRYAYPTDSLVRQLDVSGFKGEARLMDLVSKLADRVTVTQGVILLEADLSAGLRDELATLLKSENPDDRRLAAYRLGCSRSTHALTLLAGALDDRDESVRHHTLRALVRLESDFRTYCPRGRVSVFAVKPVLTAERIRVRLESAGDEASNDWLWTAELLGRNPVGGDADALLGAGKSDYAGVRKMREWVRSEFKANRMGPEAASNPSRIVFSREELLKRQAAEANPARRAELLLELGRVGGGEAWDVLIRELGNTDPVIRQAAIQALRRCPDARAVEPLMDRLTGKESDRDDRLLAAMSLGLIGGDLVVEKLTGYVAGGADPVISGTALALGYTMDRRAAPALIRCAADKSDATKGYAFTALARLGTREAVDTLMGCYNQEDNVSRYLGHAAIRLAGAGSQEAVDRFVEKVKTGGKIAPHGLEMAGDPRAVDALVGQLPGSTKERRLWIVQALGRIGDPRAVPALIGELEKGSLNEQYQAMRALRWRGFWQRTEVQAALKAHPVFRSFTEPAPGLREQPENTWVLRNWSRDLDDDRMCATTYEAGLEYDETRGRVFKWGSHGGRCDSPQTGDTWLYDVGSNRWEESRSTVHPFGMCGTWGAVYDRSNERIVSVQLEGGNHGWQWDRARTLRQSSPWVYDSLEDQWTPVKPLESQQGPGLRGFFPLVYHDPAQVVFLYGGQGGNFSRGEIGDQGWVYDGYLNTWALLPRSEALPGTRAHQGMCYLREQDRILLVGGSYGKSDKRTWLYDLAQNAWVDARPAGDYPKFGRPVVYDPVTGTALKFENGAGGSVIWQYTPASNVWRKLPSPAGPSPHHGSVDVTYDPVHNVYVLDGGHLGWETDHIGVSEVWTYKFCQPGPAATSGRLAAPGKIRLLTALEGPTRGVTLQWEPVPGAAGYRVYRAQGAEPWRVRFEERGRSPAGAVSFHDDSPPGGDDPIYYRVAAVNGEEQEGARSFFVRTQPPYPRGVTVSVRADRTVRVQWKPAEGGDIAGFWVYGCTVEVGDFHFRSVFKKIQPLERLGSGLVKGAEFVDERPLGPGVTPFAHELRAYEVRAVNVWGQESGPSATVLSLPSSVPRVTAEEQMDGTTRVGWEPNPEQGIAGYRVYRMDEYRGSCAVLLNPIPTKALVWVDEPEFPKAERRRYYVVAVDALGQEGQPSTGAWSFGRP